eukprot:11399146-Prorocentrum_lima.AAC.1
MTSSLVGSEMCIRDRCLGHPAGGHGEHVLHSLRRNLLPRVKGLISCEAVSYTHLTLPTICSV